MSNVNTVILIGRLSKDPEHKAFESGAVCNFTLVTNEKWTDKDGNRQEKPTFHKITAWGKLADICGKYLSKGSAAYIEGKLSNREYEKDGQKRYVTEVIAHDVQFLDSKKEAAPQTTDSEIPW